MCRLATMHSVTRTDRDTVGQHYHANSRSYCMQCDGLNQRQMGTTHQLKLHDGQM